MIARRFAAALSLLLPGLAGAQTFAGGGVELSTDERRRGLSWSAGRPALSADAAVAAGGLRLGSRLVSTRNAARHGGADAVADLTLSHRRTAGPIDLEVRARGHLFAGARGRLDYAEVGGAAFYSLGPVTLDAGLDYAPKQSAIGGSLLYLSAGGVAAIPRTPLTLVTSIGRTSGATTTVDRAARLRPAPRYHDWRLGVEHVRARLTLGVDYLGTDLRGGRGALTRHAGDTVTARARLSF